jgi:hypothetical protein
MVVLLFICLSPPVVAFDLLLAVFLSAFYSEVPKIVQWIEPVFFDKVVELWVFKDCG